RLGLRGLYHRVEPPPRPGIGQELEAVAPVPEHARLVAQDERADQLAVTQLDEALRRMLQKGRSDPVAGEPGADEDPGEMGVAEPPLDAARRRRRLPAEAPEVLQVDRRHQRYQDGPDRTASTDGHGHPAGRADDWPVAAVPGRPKAFSRRVEPTPVAET